MVDPRLVPVLVSSAGRKEWEEWLGRGLKGQQWADGKTSRTEVCSLGYVCD